MKANLHPTYHQDTKVTCNCGNSFTTGSTVDHISVEVCYKCHPYYTGEQRFLDTKGRVETFQKKQKAAAEFKTKYGNKVKRLEQKEREGKSLRELLGEV